MLAVTAPVSLKLMTGYPEYLAGHGWDVHVVTSRTDTNPYAGKAALHAIEMVRAPAPIRDVQALIHWVRLLRSLRPDIVVAGTPKAGLLGMVAARWVKTPIRIYLLRGLRLETENGMMRSVLWAMEWMSAVCSTQVQSVSESLRTKFVTLGLAPARKVVVLGPGSSNGVEVNPAAWGVARRDLGLAAQDFVVGCVGRISRDKGLGTLARAHRILKERGVRIRLLLVGPEEPAGTLRSSFGAGLDTEEVRWTGPVPDARPYMRLMDVLSLPSKREGFPNVVLEAAVQGVPSVVSDVTGARDAIIDGRTGLTFREGNARELADLLERLSGDPLAVESLARAARAHVTQAYRRESIWELNRRFLTALWEERTEMVAT